MLGFVVLDQLDRYIEKDSKTAYNVRQIILRECELESENKADSLLVFRTQNFEKLTTDDKMLDMGQYALVGHVQVWKRIKPSKNSENNDGN